ncbi:hypothetical protein DSM112329_01542 [Paraconexibacter sp. AEG42_29]|uniref:Uncharacterized protein n=1 Tax=Paraconexibacter sp. AEG42_29 TaxID=2997339 RepID=A0AAU7ASZ0_9ACTN
MLLRRQRFHIALTLESSVVQETFGTVLFIVVVLGVVIAGITLATAGKAYDEIGKGGLFGDDAPKPPGGGGGAPTAGGGDGVSGAVRDEEIRQMLQARSNRRVRKGHSPLDIDAELAALTRQQSNVQADPELIAEVRELVQSRNRRRVRQGKEPLDVETEVARQLSDLG